MSLTINRTLRLPEDQYIHTTAPKTGICLHHTVGGSAVSTINYWQQSKEVIGTAYVVEKDSTIYEVFDPQYWAYQFGLQWEPVDQKVAFETRFIGIEIASEGGLIEYNGNLYCFDRVSERTLKKREEAFDYGQNYRSYHYFDRYEPAQIDAVITLVNHLCDTFNIDRKLPADYLGFHDKRLIDFRGVIGHVNVRIDKSDPAPDVAFWEKVKRECGLQPVSTTADLEKLLEENLKEIMKMNHDAAGLVKSLLFELQKPGRNTYIRLHDAVPNGYVVYYDKVQGDPSLVEQIAMALGFESATDNRLEVYHA